MRVPCAECGKNMVLKANGGRKVCWPCHVQTDVYKRYIAKKNKRLAALAAERRAGSLKYCLACYGLAHRRPYTGCPKCGEPFLEDTIDKNV